MSCIELLKQELKKEFPSIDKDLQTYVEGKSDCCLRECQLTNHFSGVLSSSEDFDTSEEIYEAIGEILHEVAGNRSDEEIRSLCTKFHTILKPDNEKFNSRNRKILDAPVLLGQMNVNLDADIESMTSIWVQSRSESLVSYKSFHHSVTFRNFH